MNHRREHVRSLIEKAIPWLVLLILLIYTYAKFFQHSYIGFRVDSSGHVIFLFTGDIPEPRLQLGDRLIQVGSMRWEDFQADVHKRIFPHAKPGQPVSLLIERAGQEITIPWKVIGPNTKEINDLIFSEGWLAFFFWLAGTITLLNLRPKDERWYLLIAFNYLTAMFLAFGSGVSFYHIWGSAIFLRMIVWLCLPVYLHLHWIFPHPFRKLPKTLLWLSYVGALLFAVAEWFQLLPKDLFYIGFLVAFSGSIILLLVHAIVQSETRHDLRLLLIVSMASFLPSIVAGLVGGFFNDPSGRFPAWVGGGALLSLPLLPLAYFYTVYRRELGKLELRVNRLVIKYLFFTLLSLILFLPISLIATWFNSSGATTVIAIISVIIAGLTILWTYPRFEAFVERRLFGIRFSAENIQELYSTHITTSTSLPNLLQLLKENILDSLLIKEFVFLQLDKESTRVLLAIGVTDKQLPEQSAYSGWLNRSGIYLPPDSLTSPHSTSWIRLLLPLKLDNVSIGLWLFGRRDPDDYYAQVEISVLQALANQTAVALSNILQTERLKLMYEANIGRYEQERKRLALDLHDSILNGLASLPMNYDFSGLSPKFHQAYQELIDRLRELVSDLRPPVLNFGLKFALEDIADKLSERSQNNTEIVADIHAEADGEWTYPEVIEHHLYRIVQEASENALKYARAKTIHISGRLYKDCIDITVADDGVGFHSKIRLKPEEMVANKHFGLAGILERANLIGADITIDSKPQQGTSIHVVWMAKDSI